jgi:protein-tyrosine kinase
MERLQRALDLARQQRATALASLPLPAAAHDAPDDPAVLPPLAAGPWEPESRTERGASEAPRGRGTLDVLESAIRLASTRAGSRPPPEAAGARPEAVRAVQFLAPLDRAQLRERRVVFPDDPGAAPLAYRMLRTQLLQQAATHQLKTIGVVSALDGEGSTLTALNLALSLAAEPGQSVVLADLNLRRPALATLLGLNAGAGLEQHFRDGLDLREIATGLMGVDGLVVVPTQSPSGAHAESLAGPRSRALLASLRELAGPGLVLLDLPAALLSDDVLAIAPQLDGVVMVASARRTRRDDFARVDQMLGGVRVVGTVLNRSDQAEKRIGRGTH